MFPRREKTPTPDTVRKVLVQNVEMHFTVMVDFTISHKIFFPNTFYVLCSLV